MSKLRFSWPLIITISLSQAVAAATITGTVRNSDGKTVRGALITLTSTDGLVSETVFSNDSGKYRLMTAKHGKLMLRVRAPLVADEQQTIDVPAGDGRIELGVTVHRLTTAQEISDSLPASAHFARLAFPTPEMRHQFQTDCVSCHPIGSPLTRRVRTREEWEGTVKRMLINAAYTSEIRLKEYADILFRTFNGTPTPTREPFTVDAEALRARITEWKLKGALIAHDSEFNPADGKFYTVDQGVDSVYVTDPNNDSTVAVPLPPQGIPMGGGFAERNLATPFGLSVSHGIHSIQLGPDGLFYTTGAIGGEIGVFDPKQRTYKMYRTGGQSLYPHTLRFDAKGIVWFTVAMSNQIGRFDPRTGDIKLIDLPRDMARPDERGPLPYGIDVSPQDGSVWYSKLWGGKIGRIDPQTLEVREFTPPIFGPRRLRFDAKGLLWIPGFGDGTLSSLDIKTMQYKTYRIPALSNNEVEAPYAVAVDPRTQDVWVTSNMSDRAFRFIQKSGRFIAYPLPTRGTYFRDIIFPAAGRVCAPSSPMAPVPEVVEGGMDALVCIDTNDVVKNPSH